MDTGFETNLNIANIAAKFSSHVGTISSGGNSNPGEPSGRNSIVYPNAPVVVDQSWKVPSAN